MSTKIDALRREIAMVAAENLAVRFVVVCLLNRLGGPRPELRASILEAFDDAADQAESFCMTLGREAGDLPEVLRVIENIRMALAGKAKHPNSS